MGKTCKVVFVAALLAQGVGGGLAGEQALLEQARTALRKAGMHWATKVASHGGYVWEYSTDFVARRRGESGNLPLTTNWVQPPGTPSVGMAFLKAYEATGEKLYLDAAVAAAHCLAWGQLKSGGWTYRIEFDPARNRHLYHHLKYTRSPNGRTLRNTSTFDDNNTQSATRFLMAADAYVDDPKIDAAIARAIQCFLDAQYKEDAWDGAWPQRYPPPSRGYGGYPTFNDNTMGDCVRTMLAAYQQYGKPEHLDSVKRCIEFYLRSQQPEPQTSWAQQYGESAQLRVREILDWDGFCSKLVAGSKSDRPSPARQVWKLLAKEGRKYLQQAADGRKLDLHSTYRVVIYLNGMLTREDFYQKESYQGVDLPPQAVALLARKWGDVSRHERVRRNRMLLAAAFPGHIAPYDPGPKPAWARRFEPPSITGGESRGNMRLLMDMYVEFGDERYMQAVARAIEWYKRSRLTGPKSKGVWARFYEIGTNKPLYFTRTYRLAYTDDDLPVHYSFKSGYGVESVCRQYERLKETGRDAVLTQRSRTKTPKDWAAAAAGMESKVKAIIAKQDSVGRWVKVVANREQVRDEQGRVGYKEDKDRMLQMIYSNTFIRNVRALCAYIAAAQGGPKVSPPEKP